jgi:hypothetical protein
MADVLKHAFDLMLTPFVDGDFNPGIGSGFPSFFHFGWSCLAIFQCDPTTKLLDLAVFQHPFHFHEIGFLHVMCRMEAGLGDISVIRQK